MEQDSIMKRVFIILAAAACLGASSLAFVPAQSEKLDAPGLKRMVEGLGYEVKALEETEGKEMYEFKATGGEFDVFMATEISPSKNYIWLTVYFGEMSKREKKTDIFKKLLAENGNIQPCQFYTTKSGALKMAMPIDNRGLQSADFKRCIDSIKRNVENTVELWQEEE